MMRCRRDDRRCGNARERCEWSAAVNDCQAELSPWPAHSRSAGRPSLLPVPGWMKRAMNDCQAELSPWPAHSRSAGRPSLLPVSRLVDSPDPDSFFDFGGGKIKSKQKRLFPSPGWILRLNQAVNAPNQILQPSKAAASLFAGGETAQKRAAAPKSKKKKKQNPSCSVSFCRRKPSAKESSCRKTKT